MATPAPCVSSGDQKTSLLLGSQVPHGPSNVSIGPYFTAADLKRALAVLDLCLQDYRWHTGENRLTVRSVVDVLKKKGLTVALIRELFRRLIAEKVFEETSVTIPAGIHWERGCPLPVQRLVSETTHFLITTKERWYTYLALEREREALVNITQISDHKGTASFTAEEPKASTSDKVPDSAPATLLSRAGLVPAEEPVSFADFSPKQQKLLSILASRQPVALAAVMEALYGTQKGSTKKLEQLVTRTNRRLTAKNHPFEIKRKTNTLSLVPL
jgi:hypothetical protein